MTDLASLARRARASDDGEAFTAVAKGSGYRLGLGARAAGNGGLVFYVEIVLDPFPDRPRLEPGRVRRQAAVCERLQSRGYELSCDDSGCITCERTLYEVDPQKELRDVANLLAEDPLSERPLRRS